MDSLDPQSTGEKTRAASDFQTQHATPGSSRPSSSQSESHQSSPSRFSIPTSADSLSSGFKYDTRLRQLGVSTEEWRQFTNEIVKEAKLSFEEDKVAWGAGVATGTAGSALLFVLGPVAGYYTGKAVHKRTVVEKVKERLLDNGPMNKVLRRWNEGAWARKGFYTWIELPDEACSIGGKSDGKRFKIVVIPVASGRPKSPMSPSPAAQVSLPPSPAGPSFSQPSIPQKRPVPPPPVHQAPQNHPVPPPPAQQVPPPPPPPPQFATDHKQNYVPPPPPSPLPLAQTSNQPPPVPQKNSVVEPPSFNEIPSPTTRPIVEPPSFHPPPAAQSQPYSDQVQYRPYRPPAEISDYPLPLQLPAKPSRFQPSNNQIYEMPNNESSAVFELPDNRPSIAELPSESVHYYEMDGGGVPPVRRQD